MRLKTKKKILCGLQSCFWTFVIFSLSFFIMLFFKDSFRNKIQKLVLENLVMKKSNSDIWGDFTETNDIKIMKELKYYNYKINSESKDTQLVI